MATNKRFKQEKVLIFLLWLTLVTGQVDAIIYSHLHIFPSAHTHTYKPVVKQMKEGRNEGRNEGRKGIEERRTRRSMEVLVGTAAAVAPAGLQKVDARVAVAN